MIRKLEFAILMMALSSMGCTKAYIKSVGGDTEKVYSRIYLTDFDTAWVAVLETLKSVPLEILNRESGFVRTKWVDNTSQRNLVETFGPGQAYVQARYRFRISVARGFYDGRPSVKVFVRRDQVARFDVLEGWKRIQTDGIEENTLLYRIGRVVLIRIRLAQLDEIRARRALQEADEEFGTGPDDSNEFEVTSEEEEDDEESFVESREKLFRNRRR